MESDMTTFHSPLHFPAKSRSIRFLLACLIRKLATKNINKTELILELDQQGMEAHLDGTQVSQDSLYNLKLL